MEDVTSLGLAGSVYHVSIGNISTADLAAEIMVSPAPSIKVTIETR